MKRTTKQQRIATTQQQPANDIIARLFAFFGDRKFQQSNMQFERDEMHNGLLFKFVSLNPLEFKTFNHEKYGYTHNGIDAHTHDTMNEIKNDAQSFVCADGWIVSTDKRDGCWFLVFIKNNTTGHGGNATIPGL